MNKITKVLLSISLVVLMLTGTGVGIWYGLKNSGGGWSNSILSQKSTKPILL